MEPYGPDQALAVRARALDNRLPHVYVNRTGSEGRARFVGESLVAAPDGTPLLGLGSGAEAAVFDVELGTRPPAAVDYLRHARPDLPVELVTTHVQGATR
jgi:predicted amidohydrolase